MPPVTESTSGTNDPMHKHAFWYIAGRELETTVCGRVRIKHPNIKKMFSQTFPQIPIGSSVQTCSIIVDVVQLFCVGYGSGKVRLFVAQPVNKGRVGSMRLSLST